MAVYFVQIGTKNRKGKFREESHRVIKVPDEYNYSDVLNYFKDRYEGFEILIEHPKEMDISDRITKTEKIDKERQIYIDDDTVVNLPENIKMINELSWFPIQYTAAEKILHDEYSEHTRKAREALRALHLEISNRYEKLPYSSIGCGRRFVKEMELETSDNGTMCKKFPIRGSLFIEVAKNCGDMTMPETADPQSQTIDIEEELKKGLTVDVIPEISKNGDSQKDGEFNDIPF